MADSRIRALERRAAQGDLDAAGRVLLERVRAGALTTQQVELAAHLGHAGARRALCQGPQQREPEVVEWVEQLAPFGLEACVRAALAATRQACNALPSGRWADRVWAAFAKHQAWVDCPCAEHAEGARLLAEDVRPVYHEGGSPSEDAPLAVCYVTGAIQAETPSAAAAHAKAALECSLNAVWNSPLLWREGEAVDPPDLLEVIFPRGRAFLREAIRAELLAWALA